MKSTARLAQCFSDARADLISFLARRVGNADAEDVAHDAWLRLHERGDVDSWREPRAVLYATAANLATDHWRRARRARRLFFREDEARPAICPRPDPESVADTAGRLGLLLGALGELPAACRDAFLMNRLDGLTHAEIARSLGVSTKTVQRHIERAMRHCMAAVDP